MLGPTSMAISELAGSGLLQLKVVRVHELSVKENIASEQVGVRAHKFTQVWNKAAVL